MSRLVAVVIGLLLLAFAREAVAHGSRTAYLDVTEIGDGEALASLRSDSSRALSLTSPECTIEAAPSAARSQSAAFLRLRCPRGLGGATLAVTGMVDGSDVVIARVALQHGDALGSVLTARAPALVIPTSGAGPSVFTHYVRIGVEHVLSGLDHLLFLLALVWQALATSRGVLRSSAAELVRAATAFTIAHTVTLTATTLGWIHVPGELAELMIAASLVLVALDVGRESASRSTARLGVVLTFGLVHGLGFAGALADARLPEHATLLGLFGFNLGVELGQIIFLAVTVAAIALFLRPHPLRARAVTLSAYAIGATGAYLVISRSTFLFR